MRIALIGYGKMGRAIEAAAVPRGHEISHRIGRHNANQIAYLTPETTDVVIDFTHPEVVLGTLQQVIPTGLGIVVGTTGWQGQMGQVRQWADQAGGVVVYGANFSIGVNLMFKLNRELARLMAPHVQYDVAIEERHHRHKADAPSGTALRLARDIIQQLPHKSDVADAADLHHRPPMPNELSIGVIRTGGIVGTHTVLYTSEVDTLTLTHTAHSRDGFALGAVVAAENLPTQPGVYEFGDIL